MNCWVSHENTDCWFLIALSRHPSTCFSDPGISYKLLVRARWLISFRFDFFFFFQLHDSIKDRIINLNQETESVVISPASCYQLWWLLLRSLIQRRVKNGDILSFFLHLLAGIHPSRRVFLSQLLFWNAVCIDGASWILNFFLSFISFQNYGLVT